MNQALLDGGYRCYTGEKIDVYFNTAICQHSGNCVRGNGKLFNLKTGHYYYLDVTKHHSVSNNSNIDRYHLVIDCFVNDELKTLFKGIF